MAFSEKQPPEQSHGAESVGDHVGSDAKSNKSSMASKQPAGGLDSTPIPSAPPGYTVKITFHRATNLPMADINSLSSDPYVLAQINTSLPSRHKEDPPLRLRTPTVRRSTDPEWNCEWIVANIPKDGLTLKARIYDEDPADHDDRLGNVHVHIGNVDGGWGGIKEQAYKIKKRAGSKRAYMVRAVTACVSRAEDMHGYLYVSVEMLGRTEGDNGARCYTVGPPWWTRHYSPLLGRIANRKEPNEDQKGGGKKAEKYNFQANQFQLQGPVPAELYHRYVEFKPFVKSMFTSTGIKGFVLSKALHHQHARVYNFDRSTAHGKFSGPCREMTLKFLELVHYDLGGRIFTYVLTLDSLFRFTETGKEFGIDMLSKHSMHSDVSIYIAFSGEFLIRRLKYRHQEPDHGDASGDNETHPPADFPGGPPDADPPKDPAYYELVIDNDSGTYRPAARLLPLLKQHLSANFPGLKVITLDCQADAQQMARMKQQQRDRKKKEGDNIVFTQGSRSSSISSSDEEELDAVEAGEHGERGLLGRVQHEFSVLQANKVDHAKGVVMGRHRRPDNVVEREGA